MPEGFETRTQFCGGLWTRGRVLGQELHEELFKFQWYIIAKLFERWGRLLYMFEGDGRRRRRVERGMPRQHLVENHSEAVEIGAGICFMTGALLRRHIARRADERPGR